MRPALRFPRQDFASLNPQKPEVWPADRIIDQNILPHP